VPLYDYACAACGARFEVSHGITASGPTACPTCGGGPVKKAFAPPAILFKGAGWAKVDRRTASPSRTTKQEDATPAGDGAGSSSEGQSASPKASSSESATASSTASD